MGLAVATIRPKALVKLKADDIESGRDLIPEEKLVIAVFERALLDYAELSALIKIGPRRPYFTKHLRHLQHWIFDDSAHEWGFLWVMENLPSNFEHKIDEVRTNLARDPFFYYPEKKLILNVPTGMW